jgi:hypothetical protein
MPGNNLFAALRSLHDNRIEFILVGGLAGVLSGAPLQTYDVDIVYCRDPENVERILRWVGEVDAIFRIQSARRLRPNETHLQGAGHLNLLTRYGPVDLLAFAGSNLGFAELLPHSTAMDIGEGIRIRVLNLEKLIEIKEELGTGKDKAALPILRQTLRELRKKGSQPMR